MTETSSRLLELLSLLQARRDWPGAELAERLEVSGRTIRRDVERLRDARLSGRVADRPGRRLPAPRRHRDAAAAARRGGGDRDRGRAAHRRARVGDRHRGDLDPRARQARAGPAAAPAPPRRALGSATIAPPAHRPDRRPPASDRDRCRVPRLRVPSLRLSKPRRQRQRAARSSRTRSSTSGAAGTSSPGTAAATTGGRSASTASTGPRRPARASRRASCPRRTPPPTSREASRTPRAASRRA